MAELIASPMSPTALGWDVVMQGLNKLTLKEATNIRDYIPELFSKEPFPTNVKKLKRKVYSGMDDATAWAEETNATIPDGSIAFMFDITARQYWYANGCQYNMDMKTFDPYGMKSKQAIALGNSAKVKRQKLGAAWFNNGFSTDSAVHDWPAIETGVAFFSASHTTAPQNTTTTHSNLVAGTQSVSAFMDAIDLLMDCRDYLNRPLNLVPRRLFVYPTKVATAKEYLGIGMKEKYGTANHDRNPFGDFDIEVVPYPWFGTTTRWALQADKTSTYFNEAVGIDTRTQELANHATKQDIFFSIALWADDWRGWVGGQG